MKDIITAEETAERILKSLKCKGKWNVNKKKAIEAITIALQSDIHNSSSLWHLNPIEQASLDNFVKELPKKYKGKKVKLFFSAGNGIGIAKEVKVGKKHKDITDYLSW